ncbi:MAG: hypothetical protein AAF685_09270 [Cyanobacteria bacterium P01_C01_bin.89]
MTTKELILQKLDHAPESTLQKILQLLNELRIEPTQLPAISPEHHDGHRLINLLGTLPDDDAHEMTAAIADCRRIDASEW